MWKFAVGMSLSIVYGLYPYNGDFAAITPGWLNDLYQSTHRFVWSLTLAWISYACLTGWGGEDLNDCENIMYTKTNFPMSYFKFSHKQFPSDSKCIPFRFYQHTVITEDLGAPQSTLLSRLSDSPHSDWSVVHEPQTNYLF